MGAGSITFPPSFLGTSSPLPVLQWREPVDPLFLGSITFLLGSDVRSYSVTEFVAPSPTGSIMLRMPSGDVTVAVLAFTAPSSTLARRVQWVGAGVVELTQCVRQLLRTAPGSVPLQRAMGTPQDVVDTPESAAGARLQAAVIKAVRTYEPRVKVARVALTADADGRLDAAVEITPP